MGFRIPDDFIEPNLIAPGTPPIGDVKIDWSHPDAEFLDAFIMAFEGGLRDLVSGQIIASGGASFVGGRWVWNPTADNDQSSIVFPNGTFELDVDGPSTYLQCVVPTTGTFDESGYIRASPAEGYGLVSRPSSSTFNVKAGSDAQSFTWPGTSPIYVASLLDYDSDPSYFYANGVYVATATSTYSYANTDNPRVDVNANIHILAQWKGKWKDAKNISRDPYQFVVPKAA